MALHRLTVYILISIFTQTLQNHIERNRLGCFFAQDVFPQRQISFWLETSVSLNNPIRLNPENLTNEYFRYKLPLIILIHGHGRNRLSNSAVARPFLEKQSHYVISVDYETLAQEPCYYPWSIENTKVVGRNVARFTDNLIYRKLFARTDIQVIVRNIGAAVIGHATEFAKHRFDHVTALDATVVGFPGSNEGTVLDSSKVDFLEAIHTDFFMLGSQHSIGHVDFFVNPFSIVQPGCPPYDLNVVNFCSHDRASLLYAESFTGINRFWAKSCGSWLDMVQGKCDSYSKSHTFVRMGYPALKSIRGNFFLFTNSKSPYGKGIMQ